MSILKLILNGLDIQDFRLEVTEKQYNDNAVSKGLIHLLIRCIVKVCVTAIYLWNDKLINIENDGIDSVLITLAWSTVHGFS